ncbi:hypothetical protein PybrP1_007577 [[Pythium] brassicae (nom. inval.)]|nr:hypothetical protein PybrP1_007577 [[Pythium] brassicae (nom. inval.)]
MRLLLLLALLVATTGVARSLPTPHARVFDPLLATALGGGGGGGGGDGAQSPTITLVESLPVGNFSLASVVPQTFDALYARTVSASKTIDLCAMYWCVCACVSVCVHLVCR